jgi:protein phosphatase PTC1
MEDKIVICGNFRNHPDEDYMAVFDGHAGKEASAYCADNMHLFLESLLNQQKELDIPSCMTESFTVTHQRMKSHKSGDGNFVESGTTALIALFKENDLFIANAGDSRAVLCKNKTAQLITEDHKPTTERELKRINAITGGFVIKNRVQGKLAVARAIGDYKLNPYVTEIPDVFGPFKWIDPEYEFLILACDGLWDVMEEQKACDYVRRCRDPREAAIKLRDWAYDERSKDNISVIVIWFPGFVPDDPIIEPKKSQPVVRVSNPLVPKQPTRLSLPSEEDSESEEEDEDDDDDDEDDEDDEEDDEEEEEDKSDEDKEDVSSGTLLNNIPVQ